MRVGLDSVSFHVEIIVQVLISTHVHAIAHVLISHVHIVSHVLISLQVLVCGVSGEVIETVNELPEFEFPDQKYLSAFSNVI
jgi:hypothetical protein